MSTLATGSAPQSSLSEAAAACAPYRELLAHLRDAAVLDSVRSLLGWDQETMMPPAGAELRSDQLAALSSIAHEKHTHPRLGDLLAQCEQDASLKSDPDAQANLRWVRHDYDRATRLPTALVAEMAKTFSQSMDAWKDARAKSDFAAFAPWLSKVVDLNRKKAMCYAGTSASGVDLYDALMEDFEPGMTAAKVDALFAPLRARLVPFIEAIRTSGKHPSDAPLKVKVPVTLQKEFNKFVAASVGFDLSGGRLDVSTHPFSETVGPGDTRMTTRYRDDGVPEALLTTLHESGHSLYEQGLPKREKFGQPLASYISLGIHESQSRMWENMVGRSLAFWKWCAPEMNARLGGAFAQHKPDDLFRAVNAVKPHYIRVESDECTYNLHIMLRFDIERALIAGELAVKDVPAVWNERMRKDLGLEVKEDRIGCLQDVHWSMGAIGYFSTYTLGNLFGAQFWETINRDIPDLDAKITKGEFAPLLDWTREKIHAHGRRYPALDLCQRITGKPLGHEALCNYLERKLKPIYGL
ncbi:MAG: carboxypeptidase M32 [Phycisphaeraceae bacterium]|nr:carboxypeptidase M32 [Phycisphaeraceae bacterium]